MVRKNKIIRTLRCPILYIVLLSVILFFNLKTYNILNISQGTKISKVEVDNQTSIWNNIFEKEKIVGFIHDKGYLYNEWGWGLFLQYDVDQYGKQSKQIKVIKSFQDYLNTTLLNTSILTSEENLIVEIINMNEREFLKILLDSYWGNQEILNVIKNYIPSDSDIEKLKSTNFDEYKILSDFLLVFYRDFYPIFDIFITNNSDEVINVHSAFIEFKKVTIGSQDNPFSPSDTKSFDIETTNNWYIDIFEDYNFNNWYQNYNKLPTSKIKYMISKLFNLKDEINYVYNKNIITNKFTLDSQLVIPPDNTISFKTKLQHNNLMPCKIRFNILFNDNKIIKSDWYTFSQNI